MLSELVTISKLRVGRRLLVFLLILAATPGATFVMAQSQEQRPTAAGNAFEQRPQPWRRFDEPILSARTTGEDWCKVVCYSPHVIFHDGRFHMWYLGTSAGSRTGNMAVGYALSDDGVNWTPHADNPILTAADLPFAKGFQTPFVLFDNEDEMFKMWFVVVIGGDHSRQELGYATSRDGIEWAIHPQTIYPSLRSPMVMKVGPAEYRMWGNSAPSADSKGGIFSHIYEFSSSDGVTWNRRAEPAIRPSGRLKSCVYPYVIREADGFLMWYGGHVDGGMFELFCARSEDGTNWEVDHQRSAFAAAEGKLRFDSRYTSTPCLLVRPDRYLMYYSARDWNRDYIDQEGNPQRDNSSPYSHIGVAVLPRDADRR